LQNGHAEPVPDDAYLCLVTTKNISGKLIQRIGWVTIEKSSATVQQDSTLQMTPQQSEAVGPVEENALLTVLNEDNHTTAIISHDGEEGQIIRGKGALSFRLGDFYAGKDREQMRLTEEGNLGIGVNVPQARLDVAGAIRATQGIIFPDGSIQFSAARKTFGVESLRPDQQGKTPQSGREHFETMAAGSGTQNRLAKWLETGGGERCRRQRIVRHKHERHGLRGVRQEHDRSRAWGRGQCDTESG
jgi:hypothetical protein